MEKIEKNMYVRIKPYYCSDDITFISKITSVRDKEIVIKDFYEGWRGLTNVAYKDEILKASYKIIDLIEVGDYVNNKEVFYCGFVDDECSGYFIEESNGRKWLTNGNIKSIVTHEQFESMKYEV